MVDPFQQFLDKKLKPFSSYLKKKEVLEKIEKELTPAIKSFVKVSFEKNRSLTPEQISELVISEITKRPPKVIEKTIKTEIIRPVETIKETRIKEDKDLRAEIESLKKELEVFKQILPLGGSGVIGLPMMASHAGQVLTNDGNAPLWSDASSSSGGSSANPFYIGDSTTNGSWRLFIVGTDLSFQRLELGIWTEKGAMLA